MSLKSAFMNPKPTKPWNFFWNFFETEWNFYYSNGNFSVSQKFHEMIFNNFPNKLIIFNLNWMTYLDRIYW